MDQKMYQHSLRIPMQDIDAAGIVFFAHLFRYAHEAYEGFMEHIGFPLHEYIQHGEYLIPMRHAEADYLKPLCYGDVITIELVVKKLGNSSFTLEYACLDQAGEHHALIQTVHVIVNRADNRPVSIPDGLRTALSGWIPE